MKTIKLDSPHHGNVTIAKPTKVNTEDMNHIGFLDYLCQVNAQIIFDDGYIVEAKGQAHREVIGQWIGHISKTSLT